MHPLCGPCFASFSLPNAQSKVQAPNMRTTVKLSYSVALCRQLRLEPPVDLEYLFSADGLEPRERLAEVVFQAAVVRLVATCILRE